jgi:Fur family transcriptional regulator, ferric uptake regulator
MHTAFVVWSETLISLNNTAPEALWNPGLANPGMVTGDAIPGPGSDDTPPVPPETKSRLACMIDIMNEHAHPNGAQALTREDVEKTLSDHGYRLTSPRSAIVDAVLRHSRPFSAEQLVGELSETPSGPKIGRATVYRTLEVLAAIDVLTRIVQPDGHPTYICGTPGHRHHLLCEKCGATVTFTACPVDDLVHLLTRDTRFEIHDHVLEVFGLCPECQGPDQARA